MKNTLLNDNSDFFWGEGQKIKFGVKKIQEKKTFQTPFPQAWSQFSYNGSLS